MSSVGDRWGRRSPCPQWDARAILEHVIGFHEVLLLRPAGARANRPRDDAAGRWAATQAAVFAVLGQPLTDRSSLPEGPSPDLGRLLPMLTTDVLVHTWDLAKAVGDDATLDPDLCQQALTDAETNLPALRASGMFGAPVAAPPGASAGARLVALLGRDPEWTDPAGPSRAC